MPPQLDTITGVFARECWRPSDAIASGNDFVIAALEDGTSVKGNAAHGELIPGLSYRFHGLREAEGQIDRRTGIKREPAFLFQAFSKCEPHSRFGMVKYLARYCPGVGPGIAGRMFDLYQGEACKILRTDPERVSREIPRLSLTDAREASVILAGMAELEDTKIELTNMFAGRGFPHALVDQCIRKWGASAPARVARDPFSLLVHDFAGCGFARCDRLFTDKVAVPTKLQQTKRQMICLWHALRSDNDGHTWIPLTLAENYMRRHIGESQDASERISLERTVRFGMRSGWLAGKIDSAGVKWIAEGDKAANEEAIARKLGVLMSDPVVMPRFTEAVEGECDHTDALREPVCRTCNDLLYVTDNETGNEAECPECMTYASAQRTAELLGIGRQTGICQWCSRRLTHPISIALGIGPVCAARNHIPWEMPHGTGGDSLSDSLATVAAGQEVEI